DVPPADAEPSAPPPVAPPAPPAPPDPWWKRLAWGLYLRSPRQVADAAGFVQPYTTAWRNRSLPLAILRGPSVSGGGATATVLAVGKPAQVEFLTGRIFAEAPSREAIGEVKWWSLHKKMEEWESRVDLSVARVPTLFAPRIAAEDALITP